jgi:hypothetical protein
VETLEGRQLLSSTVATTTPATTGNSASIGINLDAIFDWSTIAPFNDLGTYFRTWGQPATPYAPDPSIPVTSDNYPLADAGAITFAFGYPDGQYAVSYDGQGALNFAMGPDTTYTVTSHVGDHWTGVLDLHHNGNFLSMTLTGINPADPIHNLHIISPDADPAISDTYRPVFLQKLAPFNGPLRTMDWLLTNNNTDVNWADRTSPNRFSYAAYDVRPGVPYEQIITLANTLHRDLWINVPVSASDDYVHNLAVLLRDTLDPSLKVYVEYSNELWNGLFAQSATNLANARADATITATDDFGKGAQEAAKRLVGISNLFRADFGEARFAAQVRPEFGAWAAISNWAQIGLDYIKSHYGEPKNLIAGVAIGDYVGDQGSLDAIDNATLTPDKLFAWMNNFIDTTLTVWIKGNKAVADQYGVALDAYEGGQALTATNGQNEAIKQAAQDDPRMGDFYRHLIRNWVENGGRNFNHYATAGSYGAYGYWGMFQSIDQPTSVKFSALASMVGWGFATSTEELATTTTSRTPSKNAKSVHNEWAVRANGGHGMTFVPVPLRDNPQKRLKDRWIFD